MIKITPIEERSELNDSSIDSSQNGVTIEQQQLSKIKRTKMKFENLINFQLHQNNFQILLESLQIDAYLYQNDTHELIRQDFIKFS